MRGFRLQWRSRNIIGPFHLFLSLPPSPLSLSCLLPLCCLSQIVIDSETLLILGGCGGPNAVSTVRDFYTVCPTWLVSVCSALSLCVPLRCSLTLWKFLRLLSSLVAGMQYIDPGGLVPAVAMHVAHCCVACKHWVLQSMVCPSSVLCMRWALEIIDWHVDELSQITGLQCVTDVPTVQT